MTWANRLTSKYGVRAHKDLEQPDSKFGVLQ